MVPSLARGRRLQHGEAAGLRWRHHDPAREPLGRLLVAKLKVSILDGRLLEPADSGGERTGTAG